MTEKVYQELDDAKTEIERLKSENIAKANLCENLKRSKNDQLKKIQELNLKLEKQAQEVDSKADEVYAAKQSLEELECKLRENDKVIVSITSANDKLRADLNSKLRECEAEKQMLISSLEEANVKILNLEDQNRAFMDKIEVLKEGIVSVSQKKCASESKIAKASKQMRERGDMFEKLEEEKEKLEEELKWKNERFKHLEEAHETVRNKLRVKENEWDIEKRTFFEDISALETKLDSQITVSEDLKTRLESCKQALAREEDQRKRLEIQLSECDSRFADAKAELDHLIIEKERVCKEMERKIREMKEENQEAANPSSIVKLQNEIKTLEEINNVNEAEWASRIGKMVAEMNDCRRELESKETRLKEIMADVDDCNSLVLQLTMEKEEFAVMMVALKSILLETRSKIDEEKRLLHKQIKSYEDQLARTKSEMMSVKEELDQSYCELNEVEFELHIWKSVSEKLETDLKVNHRMRRELEASLLAQVATEVNLKEVLKQKEIKINDLEKDIKDLKEEWVAKELEAAILAQLESERIHECEKQNLNQLVEQKDQRIHNLQEVMSSLEREFDHSTASFSLQLAKMQAEMKMFHEVWEKMRTTMVLKEIEVQEKGLMITELDKDLEARIRFAKTCMSRVKKLSLENEKLMGIIEGASEWISKLAREDGQMMGALRSIMSGFDENQVSGSACSELTGRFDPVKENKNVYHHQSSPKRNVVDNSVDERSPLRTMNG